MKDCVKLSAFEPVGALGPMILGTGRREVSGICIDDVLINSRELLGSLENNSLAQRLVPAGTAGEAGKQGGFSYEV